MTRLNAGTDRHAVVVGGGGAIGSAIARRLAAAGLSVLVVGRRRGPLQQVAETAPGIQILEADIAHDDSVAAIRNALYGPVAMLVQAAGLPASGGLDTIHPDAIGAAVNLKVGGLLRLVRAAGERLGPGSRVMALGGHYGAEPNVAATAAGVTNAALANLNRQLADFLGPRGITSHLIAPGPVDSERLHEIATRVGARQGLTQDEVLAGYRSETALGRLTSPSDVAWAAVTLLEDEAATLTGSIISLDCGVRRGTI